MTPYSSLNLPNFVRDWAGYGEGGARYASPDLYQLHRGLWVLIGHRQSLMIHADSAASARCAVRDYVAQAAPKTDKRRAHWIYT